VFFSIPFTAKGMMMRSNLFRAALLLILLLSACNLTSPEEEIPTPTTRPSDVGGKPAVVINSPVDGTASPVNREILVSATATDAVGVTRMQLLANGNIVKTVTSETVAGQTTFNAVLNYTPTQTGDVVLRVVAFRGAIISDPREITVKVGAQNVPTSTTQPGGGNPGNTVPTVDPFDQTCRARADTGLNMRLGPGVDFAIVRVLVAGEVAPIVGRLGDNSWWQIRYLNTIGWVSSLYTTEYGNCLNVPIVAAPTPSPQPTLQPSITPTITPFPSATPQPTAQPLPADLVVPSLVGPSVLIIRTGATSVTQNYSFTITNTGQTNTGQTTTSVQVIPGGTVQTISTGSLRPGESIALNTDLTFNAPGQYRIEVIADASGIVSEISEVNNTGTLNLTVNTQ
jgi:uncharacterized protein YgiM (DUF1202 family)